MPARTQTVSAASQQPACTELINLRTGTITRCGGDIDRLVREAREPLIACETRAAGNAHQPPVRVYRRTGPVDHYWPRCTPTEIYFRSSADPAARFGEDVSPNQTDDYSYAGWLPLGLVTHPDGMSEHHACTTGDIWLTEPANAPRPDGPGPTDTAVTAADCLRELTARAASEVWRQTPPDQWPWSPAQARRALETITRELAKAAGVLDYELRVERNHEKTAGTYPGSDRPKSRAHDTAARLRNLIRTVHGLDLLNASTIALPPQAGR